MTPERVTAALRAARRSLDALDGVAVLGDWSWHEPIGHWILKVRLRLDTKPTEFVPAETDWFIFAKSAYPRGQIAFFPAAQAGLTSTFPHQHYNRVAASGVAWRMGDICVDDFVSSLGRAGCNPEPEDADGRLQWRVSRALDWLRAAAEDRLLPPGAPFEMPDFPEVADAPHVVFSEDAESFGLWRECARRWGIFEAWRPPAVPDTIVVERLLGRGKREVHQPDWGYALTGGGERTERGIWIRLECVPVAAPWQAPLTWGELRRLLAGHGCDLDALLRPALRTIRDGRSHIMVIGFPIPRIVGKPAEQMHWQGLQLPVLCLPYQVPNGWRRDEPGQWQADRYDLLAASCEIRWLPSQNWNPREVSTRGRFPEEVAGKNVLVVGAGALGSATAEMLVRGGVTHVVIMDSDAVQVGNLVRHTLDLTAIGASKAAGVAAHLNLSNPAAQVEVVATSFPPTDELSLMIQSSNLVIDTTGSNEVISSLAEFRWAGPVVLASVSLSLGARRLYAYAAAGSCFSYEEFRRTIDPLVMEDFEHAEGELPWEGIGCWHPVFPARSDDVWLLAAAAVKRLADLARTPLENPQLIVFEQVVEDGVFGGVRSL